MRFITVMRFTAVTFGVGPTIRHLGVVINHHLRKYESSDLETVKKIDKGLYADDFSGGETDDEKAVTLYRKTRSIFKDANMNMRKWRSNSQAVMEAVAEDEGCNEESSESNVAKMILNPEESSPVKVLGIPWDTVLDMLTFSLKGAISRGQQEGEMTKSRLLGASASLFDLIGLLAPVTFALKSLFQAVCISGIAWEDVLGADARRVWERWLSGAEKVREFVMPRCYIPEILSCSEVVLVGFCDASEKGYAAVIYIRGDFGDEMEVRTNFVSSKTKVAPIAKQTIPRLELLGALLLAMLLKRVMDILVNTI